MGLKDHTRYSTNETQSVYNRHIQAKITKEQQQFIVDLETVSIALAVWAQGKVFVDGWSIEDVKVAIRNAAKVCGREV